jgi:hypothetical protein
MSSLHKVSLLVLLAFPLAGHAAGFDLIAGPSIT